MLLQYKVFVGIGQYRSVSLNFYRYAETLLSAAEAIAQSSGVNAEAAGYLAQVKARANMEGKDVSTIASDQINKLNLTLVCSGDLREFTCTNTVIPNLHFQWELT